MKALGSRLGLVVTLLPPQSSATDNATRNCEFQATARRKAEAEENPPKKPHYMELAGDFFYMSSFKHVFFLDESAGYAAWRPSRRGFASSAADSHHFFFPRPLSTISVFQLERGNYGER